MYHQVSWFQGDIIATTGQVYSFVVTLDPDRVWSTLFTTIGPKRCHQGTFAGYV